MAVSLEPMTVRPPAVPPFSLLEMADQSFERYRRSEKPSRQRVRTWLARLLTHPVKGLENYRELLDTLTMKGPIKVFCEVAGFSQHS